MKQKNDDKNLGMQVNINLDTTPIFYTDNISMVANEDGVILDVIQRVSSNQGRVVSRVGMSREHAKKFVGELGKLIIATERSAKVDKSDFN